MNIRSLILVVAALFIAGLTAVLARNLMSGAGGSGAPGTASAESNSPKILVAATPLPVGHILEAANVRWQKWPKESLDQAYFVEGQATIEKLVGKVVRYTVTPGQPVTQATLVGPGERGFLAAVLSPDMRAITVSISDTSGVAGFVFPGDRVDLVLTHEVERQDMPTLKISETVLRNVRVLAVDQRTSDAVDEPKVGRTVTLEVTPKLVEKISVMQRLGSLSLSLRPLAQSATSNNSSSQQGATEPDITDTNLPTDQAPTYTVGADITKFANLRKESSAASPGPAVVNNTGTPRPRGPVVAVLRGSKTEDVAAGGK